MVFKTIVKFVMNHRVTEPKELRLTKIFFSLVFFSAIIVYIYYIIENIRDDKLSVKYSTRKNHLAIPTINITTPFKMEINCTYLSADGLGVWKNQVTSPCNDRIEGPFENYMGNTYKFTPPDDRRLEISESGVRQLNLIFTVTTVPENINDPEIIKMQFFDEELSRIGKKYTEEQLHELINSTEYVNTYALDANRHIRFSLVRVEREYLSRNWRSYLGYPGSNQLIKLPLMSTSKFLDYPMIPEQTSSSTKILSIGLFALTNLVLQEREIKDDTVGGWVGSIGGLVGLMLTVFTVLFGTKSLAPFGIVQKFCCISRTKRKFENLPIIPLVKDTRLDEDKADISYLTKRLHSLETVLTDYVISPDLFQGLADESDKAKVTS